MHDMVLMVGLDGFFKWNERTDTASWSGMEGDRFNVILSLTLDKNAQVQA